MGPLAGVRILDMTTVLMGPYATQTLAEMGAEVIKVEAPEGDLIRQIAPNRNPGMGALFLNANRGKRSLCLDLKDPAGRAVLLQLAAQADVLIYNVRPQAMRRLGLDYETLAAANPRLVYAGLHGFGQDGPYADKPAYDDLIQGAALFPFLIAQAGDGVPRYVPVALADRVVGLAAVGAVCAALVHRERTGEGQAVEVPMFETLVGLTLGDHLGGLSFDPPEGEGGYRRLLSPERRPFRTLDGYVCAVVYTDKQWTSFLAAVDRADLPARDSRFATFAARTRHIDHVYAALAKIFLERTTADWLELLDRADVPAMPMHDDQSLLDDPHLKATGAIRDIDHPSEGRIRTLAPATRWSKTPSPPQRPAPRLGQDSVEVLREAGLDPAAIDALVAAGVVRLPESEAG
jgi:crotonobetainyl-CoA:carnitine CoA-transferase CaiB-like acyl-CoA transferase